MNIEIKDRWVKALLSGKYDQCTEVLRCGNEFCCLGVLADLMGCDWKNPDNIPRVRELIKGSKVTVPMQKKLAKMNDNGASFIEIASYIRANL